MGGDTAVVKGEAFIIQHSVLIEVTSHLYVKRETNALLAQFIAILRCNL
jgi:hypothetical protein